MLAIKSYCQNRSKYNLSTIKKGYMYIIHGIDYRNKCVFMTNLLFYIFFKIFIMVVA